MPRMGRTSSPLLPLTAPQQRLVERNLGLVGYALKRLSGDAAVVLLGADAYQIGCLALMRAATHFDASRGQFSTFAFACIRQAVRNAVRDVVTKIRTRSLRFDPAALSERVADVPDWVGLVAGLDGGARRLLALRFQRGLTQRQTAERLGVSHITERRREYAALGELRRTLDPRVINC